MRLPSKTVFLGAVIALIFGLILALPLFQSNLDVSPTSFEKPFITFDVSYAYFSLPSYGQNVIGLNSSSNIAQGEMVNYILVLNITNYSNTTVFIDGLRVYAATSINTTNTKNEFKQGIAGAFLTLKLGSNPYDDMIDQASHYLGPYQSKLLALSGTTELGWSGTALQTGTFDIGGYIDGSVGDWHSMWGGSKQIQVQNFGNEYLYNNLLLSNQTLHLQGNNVTIQ